MCPLGLAGWVCDRANRLALTTEERDTLERWARRPTTAQALVLRARLVLRCAAGETAKGPKCDPFTLLARCSGRSEHATERNAEAPSPVGDANNVPVRSLKNRL